MFSTVEASHEVPSIRKDAMRDFLGATRRKGWSVGWNPAPPGMDQTLWDQQSSGAEFLPTVKLKVFETVVIHLFWRCIRLPIITSSLVAASSPRRWCQDDSQPNPATDVESDDNTTVLLDSEPFPTGSTVF